MLFHISTTGHVLLLSNHRIATEMGHVVDVQKAVAIHMEDLKMEDPEMVQRLQETLTFRNLTMIIPRIR